MVEYDSSNPKHVAILRKAANHAERSRREFMGHIMSTMPGRQWIHDKLLLTHIFEASFVENALKTAFREGERNVGLSLLADIMKFCPDQYIVMMREANGRDAAIQSRLERSDEDADGRYREPNAYVHPGLEGPPTGPETDYNPTDGLDEGDEA